MSGDGLGATHQDIGFLRGKIDRLMRERDMLSKALDGVIEDRDYFAGEEKARTRERDAAVHCLRSMAPIVHALANSLDIYSMSVDSNSRIEALDELITEWKAKEPTP